MRRSDLRLRRLGHSWYSSSWRTDKVEVMQRVAERLLSARAAYPSEAGVRRFDQRSRFILAFAVLLLFVGVTQKAYRLSLPTTGWSTLTAVDSNVPIFERNLLGVRSPLRVGDALLAVEGVDLGAVGKRPFLPAGVPGTLQVGEEVGVTVLRNAERVALEVPLHRWTMPTLLGALLEALRENYAGWLALLLAGYVFWRQPKNTAAQLLLLFFVTKLMIDISRLISSQSLEDLLFPLASLSSVLIGHLSYVFLLAPLLLHLCLSFPEPKPFLQSPWRVGMIYGAPWLIGLTTLLLGAPLQEFQRSLFLLVGVYSLLTVLAFVHTFSTTTDLVHRAQVRWVTFGFVVSSLAWVVWVLGALGIIGAELPGTFDAPTDLILASCLGVAVLRYRLFDIDLVINRTLVYGALSAGVILLYVLVVGALGTLFNQANLTVSLVATGLVAILFQPLRERLQQTVNRLMYGERDEPYKVLARLSASLEGSLSPERVLPASLETVTKALKLPHASVLLYRDGVDEVLAEQGCRSEETDSTVFPLVYQGETFGELRLEPRAPGETFSPAELSLLGTIAQQVSVAAYAVQQTLDLRRSRERLITAREEERLRIRRDLHDGLGPTLAGLNLQASTLKRLIATQHEAAQTAVHELQGELRKAVGEVRGLVHDLRPPSLDQLGLKGALEGLAEGLNRSADLAPIRITTDIPDLPTLPPATEVATYRIVQEALANTLKHAQASQAAVTLRLGSDLKLTLWDDGIGIPGHYRAGVGLRSMRERVEELSGTFEIVSRSQQGTTILVCLPLHD